MYINYVATFCRFRKTVATMLIDEFKGPRPARDDASLRRISLIEERLVLDMMMAKRKISADKKPAISAGFLLRTRAAEYLLLTSRAIALTAALGWLATASPYSPAG